MQRDGNHELFFSFRCRHLSTKLTLLCTQSTNSHRMTPYLLKYFHNTQHVLPQVMSGQACNVSLYLSLTNIRAHQSFLLSIVCSGSPSTDLYTRGCRLGLDQPEEGSLPAVLLMHSKLTQGTAWLTCSCALHVPVSYTSLCLTHSCLTCPCVVHVPVPYMFSYLTCSCVLHVPLSYMSLCLTCPCGFSFNYNFNTGLNTVVHFTKWWWKPSQIL